MGRLCEKTIVSEKEKQGVSEKTKPEKEKEREKEREKETEMETEMETEKEQSLENINIPKSSITQKKSKKKSPPDIFFSIACGDGDPGNKNALFPGKRQFLDQDISPRDTSRYEKSLKNGYKRFFI